MFRCFCSPVNYTGASGCQLWPKYQMHCISATKNARFFTILSTIESFVTVEFNAKQMPKLSECYCQFRKFNANFAKKCQAAEPKKIIAGH